MTSPYSGLPDHHFWRRSIQSVESHLLDPVVRGRFQIGASDRIATAGSCFAQHIARRLQQLGNYYFVTETGAGLGDDERMARQYGLFSARYGNIYTTAQLWQLYQRAYGEFAPQDIAWRNRQGRWIDPFRQTVEPDGFDSIEALVADRQTHFCAVRQLFEDCDILVFTLGLTEGWRSRSDGAVYPLAPGVAGGDYDQTLHEFVNFTLAETEANLTAFLDAVKARNPKLKVLLTVSPVPLAATCEDRSVLVSTTYSKSVLRVAAENAMRRFDWIDYFPSYEIITGSPIRGNYYEDDDREVNPLGVAHVMRLFVQHFVTGIAQRQSAIDLGEAATTGAEGVVCDEALISSLR
ncbi:MAG: GSCFA domain-containing protein [Pseudomonadota bacterium]